MAKKTGVTLFDLEEGETFYFGYDPKTIYRLMGFNDDDNAVVREQCAGAEDTTANPYYNDIHRVTGLIEMNQHIRRGGA